MAGAGDDFSDTLKATILFGLVPRRRDADLVKATSTQGVVPRRWVQDVDTFDGVLVGERVADELHYRSVVE